jgi:HSP20 family protein
MSALIQVETYPAAEALPRTLWEEMNEISSRIREQAFRLFQSRGATEGQDLDDWLRAEREVVWSPASEVVESERDFRVQVALPGFSEKDLQVTATPDALIVEAEKTHSHDAEQGNVRLCEFSSKKLFRRLDLPSAINVEQVKASLENGILQVTAPKATQPQQMTATA